MFLYLLYDEIFYLIYFELKLILYNKNILS